MNGDAIIGQPNLEKPSELAVRQLAETVLHPTGSKSELAFRHLPQYHPVQHQPDITKAKQVLGWESPVTVEYRLKEIINYFRKLPAS